MNSAKNTDEISRRGGGNASVTPLTALLNRRLGTSPAPRMLTPYEIELLQQSKKEMAEVAVEALAAHSDSDASPEGLFAKEN